MAKITERQKIRNKKIDFLAYFAYNIITDKRICKVEDFGGCPG